MANSFFGEPFRRLFFTQWPSGYGSAPMDWVETQSSHIITINIPGLGRDEVKINLEEGNILHIKGEVKDEEKKRNKDAIAHVLERGFGDFERRLGLPDNVRTDHIKANVENGVLTVVVPKEPIPAKPKPRSIPVSSKL